MKKLKCKTIEDGENYYIGDIVKYCNDDKVSHVLANGKNIAEIIMTNDIGQVAETLGDGYVNVVFCLHCPFAKSKKRC